ncbi:unnamed protein product, partial [Thlaspi arvense]
MVIKRMLGLEGLDSFSADPLVGDGSISVVVNPHIHQVKLCNFGSEKAPELIFGATEYTTAIDVWSAGCVLAELLLGQPLFFCESGVDQLVEIIEVLGKPTREEIKCINPNYTEFKFPHIKAYPWYKIFHKRMPPRRLIWFQGFFNTLPIYDLPV